LLAFHWISSPDSSTVLVAYYGAQSGRRAVTQDSQGEPPAL
jgi:hypothetical protein